MLQRPIAWGGMYVLLIPVFATVFSLLPHGSFHDDNLSREEALPADTRQFLNRLTQELRASAHPTTWKTAASPRPVRLDPRTLTADALNPRVGRRIVVRLTGMFRGTQSEPQVTGSFSEWVEVEPDAGHIGVVLAAGRAAVGFPVELRDQRGAKTQPSFVDPPLDALFGTPFVDPRPPSPSTRASKDKRTGGWWFLHQRTVQRLLRLQGH